MKRRRTPSVDALRVALRVAELLAPFPPAEVADMLQRMRWAGIASPSQPLPLVTLATREHAACCHCGAFAGGYRDGALVVLHETLTPGALVCDRAPNCAPRFAIGSPPTPEPSDAEGGTR
jgi:hypothetical protein